MKNLTQKCSPSTVFPWPAMITPFWITRHCSISCAELRSTWTSRIMRANGGIVWKYKILTRRLKKVQDYQSLWRFHCISWFQTYAPSSPLKGQIEKLRCIKEWGTLVTQKNKVYAEKRGNQYAKYVNKLFIQAQNNRSWQQIQDGMTNKLLLQL